MEREKKYITTSLFLFSFCKRTSSLFYTFWEHTFRMEAPKPFEKWCRFTSSRNFLFMPARITSTQLWLSLSSFISDFLYFPVLVTLILTTVWNETIAWHLSTKWPRWGYYEWPRDFRCIISIAWTMPSGDRDSDEANVLRVRWVSNPCICYTLSWMSCVMK